jgi:hypothetical protein
MFGHPSDDRLMLLSFRDRTPRTGRGPIQVLGGSSKGDAYHVFIP